MKLIIQIPCYNEEKTLPATLAGLPRQVPGCDRVEILVVDDGSTDRTAEVARTQGADHVVRLTGHQGLARAFMAGLNAALELDADVIVNTDADNQYDAGDVPRLVAPILVGEADIVIGARPIAEIRHFSLIKRLLQRLGSRVVSELSHAPILDAPSGFRAMRREAAMQLNVFSHYTYTLETLIQAGLSNLRITDVPVRVNAPTRPSRLIRSTPQYLRRSILAMLSAFLIYRPTQLFTAVVTLFLAPGLFLGGRYLYFMAIGEGQGHVQSVIVGAVFVLAGIFMAAIGVVAYLLAINRRLLEELRYLERARRGRPGRSGDAGAPEARSWRG